MKNQFASVVFFLFSFHLLTAQADDFNREGKAHFGINLGGYFANKYSASRYDGTRDFGIGYLIGIPNIYNSFYDELGGQDFKISEFPDDMRYKPAFSVGGHVAYFLSNDLAIIGDLDIINLKATDKMLLSTVNTNPNNNGLQPNNFHEVDVIGEEKRLSINLGMRLVMNEKGNTNIYTELGGNITNTRVATNQIILGDLQYSVVDPQAQSVTGVFNNNQEVDFGGIGYGGFIGLGTEVRYNDKFKFNLGANLIMTRIPLNVDNLDTPPKMKPQAVLFARIIFG